MTSIIAAQALLPEGWVQDVCIEIADNGRIARVDRRTDEHTEADQRSDAERVQILLPSPANLHSHAFQRAMAGLTEHRGPDPTDSFWTWRRLMYQFLDQLTPDDIEIIAAFVQMEMLEAGYATNVEFHYLHNQPGGMPYDNPAELSARIAAATVNTGIGMTLLPVHYQYGGCDKRALNDGQRRFGSNMREYEHMWAHASRLLNDLPSDTTLGVAPHSLRAIAADSLQPLQQIAPDAPFHMHLAEQLAEVDEVQHFLGNRPVEWLLENTDVNERWCLIHCTQMNARETIALARSGAVAGLCPITESSLGDGIFDGVNYLAADGRIGVGSDSNIRISLSEELRTLDYSQRLRDHSRAALATAEQSTGRRLFEEIVRGGAQAAGRDSGKIEEGCWADLMTLDATHIDLQGLSGDGVLDMFIFAGDDRMVSEVWAAGRHQVIQGQHVNREAITRRYRKVINRLRSAV